MVSRFAVGLPARTGLPAEPKTAQGTNDLFGGTRGQARNQSQDRSPFSALESYRPQSLPRWQTSLSGKEQASALMKHPTGQRCIPPGPF
ncbi:hypothetical protein CLIM01_10211 [Colletotrichum limetticola]|uniref:Uncharacterized protein n=1 Tax=Colletotrichum limetticola TaxID=1209924 RepID=A0ABQ9PL93_9PEZI|nr:hypothetical protein CLIM01_10211 [Colletotrichum limetticola]